MRIALVALASRKVVPLGLLQVAAALPDAPQDAAEEPESASRERPEAGRPPLIQKPDAGPRKGKPKQSNIIYE